MEILLWLWAVVVLLIFLWGIKQWIDAIAIHKETISIYREMGENAKKLSATYQEIDKHAKEIIGRYETEALGKGEG